MMENCTSALEILLMRINFQQFKFKIFLEVELLISPTKQENCWKSGDDSHPCTSDKRKISFRAFNFLQLMTLDRWWISSLLLLSSIYICARREEKQFSSLLYRTFPFVLRPEKQNKSCSNKVSDDGKSGQRRKSKLLVNAYRFND